MNAKKQTTYSGALLRAMRDERSAAEDPEIQARRREQSFLRAMSNAKEDFDWLCANSGWTLLGFATFTDWWDERVAPVSAGLGMRPARDVAKVVIEKVAEDEKALPKAQRRTQRQIAEMVGLTQSTVSRSTSDANASGGDLENDPIDSFPAAKDAIQKTLDNQAAAATEHLRAADGEPESGDLNAGSSAAGPTDFPPAGPAETPEDHRDLDHPGDAADTGLQPDEGDETADGESPSPSLSAVAQREQQDGAGVSQPAAPATGTDVPAYIRKASALFEAVYDLIEEDPTEVGDVIDLDLGHHITAAVAALLPWVKAMQDAMPDDEEPA